MAYNTQTPIIPNGYYQNQYYPSMQPQPIYQQQVPSFQITKVNGENGAKAFQMPPNSSIILLDESNPKVYIKETDGASYPTDLTPVVIESTVVSRNPYSYTSDGTYKYLLVVAIDPYSRPIQNVSVSGGCQILISNTGGAGYVQQAEVLFCKLVKGGKVSITFRTDGAGVTRSIWGFK